MSKMTNALAGALTLALVAGTAHAATRHHVAQVRSEVSKQCSADADAKNLHGKERQTFRRKCIAEHTPKVTAKKAPASTSAAEPAADASNKPKSSS